MSMRAIKDVYTKTNCIQVAAHTATTNGTGVDLANMNENEIVYYVGTWTDGTHTPKLQDSADNSTFADCATGDVIGSFTAVTANGSPASFQPVSYIGSKRYVRIVVTRSGTTTGLVDGAFANTRKRKQP